MTLVIGSSLEEYPMIKPGRLVEMMEGTYSCNKYEDI